MNMQKEGFREEAEEQLQNWTKDKAILEKALLKSQARYQFIFNASPTPFAIFDATKLRPILKALQADGVEDLKDYFEENPHDLEKLVSKLKIVDGNQAAVKLAGAKNKEQLTSNPEVLLSYGFTPLFIDLIKLMVDGAEKIEGVFTGRSYDNQEKLNRYTWHVFSEHKVDYSQILLAMVEITSLAQTEAKLNSALERLQIIQKIESNILQAETAEAIADIALKNLNSIVPCKSSAVTLFDAKYQFSQMLAGFNTDRKTGSRFVLTPSPIKDEIFAGKSVIVNDIPAIASKSPLLRSVVENGGQSIMIVPLIIQGEIIGSINLISGMKDAFSELEKEIVNQISKSVAVAIQNAQIVQTERKARREADILREVAANINAQVDQETLLEQILIQLAHVLPYDSASILQYKDDKLTVTARNGMMSYENIKDIFHPIPPNLAELIATQKPIIIPDTENYPGWKNIPELENTRCWLGAPLITKGSFFGILTLMKLEPDFYNEQSANLALAFANHAAIAIENARLYRETQKFGEKMQQQVALRTRDLAALYEITTITSQFSDLQSILEKVISKIASALDCEQLTLHLLDDNLETLHLAYSLGLPSEIEQLARKIPLEHPIIRMMYEDNETYFTQGGQPDPLIPGAVLPPRIKNGLGCPIRYKGQFYGILGLINKRQPFTREDIALITSITDQIGIAIENDRLRKQSEKAVISQERERLARDLHDSITQSLFSLTMFAAAARELLRNGSIVDAEDFLTDIAITSNQTHKEMRLLLYELQPSALAEEGLAGALRHRLDAVESRSGIKATFNEDINITLYPEVERALFHVANEALNNTLKHSQATDVSISVETQEDVVRIEIKDNGIGFKAGVDEQDGRMGLSSMKQRIASINGNFKCRTSPGKGTSIIVSVPLSQ